MDNLNIDLNSLEVCEIDSSLGKMMRPKISAEDILKETLSDNTSVGWESRLDNKQKLLEYYKKSKAPELYMRRNIDSLRENFGKNLIKLRDEFGFTASDMAEIFNCSKMNYGNWERRGNMPKCDGLLNILDFFEIELKDLLADDLDTKAVLENVLKHAEEIND